MKKRTAALLIGNCILGGILVNACDKARGREKVKDLSLGQIATNICVYSAVIPVATFYFAEGAIRKAGGFFRKGDNTHA